MLTRRRFVVISNDEVDGEVELGYLLALSAATMWSPRPIAGWVASLGSARAVVERVRAGARQPPDGVEPLGADALDRVAAVDEDCARRALGRARECNARIVTSESDDYPARLRGLCDAPLVLYCRGRLDSLRGRAVAIVGSRAATPYGRAVAASLAAEFGAYGAVVVSGLARGIDAAAHRAALQTGTPTVAVLGSGLAALYPDYHSLLADEIVAGGGALLTEFPPDAPALSHQFPMRNRIVAALAHATVVVEAGSRSGALITARLADEFGHPVFAIPGDVGRPTSAGSNALIADGVPLATSAADVAAQLGWTLAAACASPAAAGADPLLALLATGPTDVDELSARAGLDVATVSARLTLLEVQGLVERARGGHFVAVTARRAPQPKHQ